MGKVLRLSEQAYAALLNRTGSRAAPAPAVQAQNFVPTVEKPQDRMLALGRLPAGVMNPTESAYAALLELEKQAGLITWYAFEPIKLRLGKNTFYTPDFGVRLASGELELREVKGFWRDDARVKIKNAAYMYPIFRFVAVTKKKKRDGGGWEREEF